MDRTLNNPLRPLMNLKPIAGLTKALCVIVGLLFILDILEIFAGLVQYYGYSQLDPSGDLWDAFVPVEIVDGIIGLGFIFLYLISIVVFLTWIHRTNKNLRALSGEEMEYTPGWAVGWYFVPIANIFKPFKVMQEIWTIAHRRQEESDAIVNIWWTFWILGNVLSRISTKMAFNAEDIPAYMNAILADVACDVASAALDVVFIMMLLQIARAYAKNYDEQAGPVDMNESANLAYSTPVSEFIQEEMPIEHQDYNASIDEQGGDLHHDELLDSDDVYDESDMDAEFGMPLDDPHSTPATDDYDDGFDTPEDDEYR